MGSFSFLPLTPAVRPLSLDYPRSAEMVFTYRSGRLDTLRKRKCVAKQMWGTICCGAKKSWNFSELWDLVGTKWNYRSALGSTSVLK